MKQFPVVFFLVLINTCFSPAVLGQPNVYFENQAVWQIQSTCNVGGYCIQQESYNYYVNGDTMLDAVLYKKIFRKGQGSYQWFAPPPVPPGCLGTYYYIDPLPCFFLRSADRQIFIRPDATSAEALLYDFNLEVNDTLPLSYNINANTVIVTAIDSIPTPQGYRLRFSLSGDTWSQYLIEGIGHSNGLTEPMQVALECGWTLSCFSLEGTACYPAAGPGCDLAVGVPDQEAQQPFRLAPNPFSHWTRLEIPPSQENTVVKVYDARFQLLQVLHTDGTQPLLFHRAGLPPGIYFFVLSGKTSPDQVIKGILLD